MLFKKYLFEESVVHFADLFCLLQVTNTLKKAKVKEIKMLM